MNYALSNQTIQLDWYITPEFYERDQAIIASAAEFVGHATSVPNLGDYSPTNTNNGAKVLIRNNQGIQLLQNICRHRQSIMLASSGNIQNIVCPLHGWTYDLEGRQLGAPHSEVNPGLDLAVEPLTAYQGLQFRQGANVATELASLPVLAGYDFSDYRYHTSREFHHDFNWKVFMEVYLDLYHVDAFHPGLSSLVDTGTARWEFGAGSSAQILGYRSSATRSSEIYQLYRQALATDGITPAHGAIWVTVYPNIMLEIYPGALVVSTIKPTGPTSCTNFVDFYYPESTLLFGGESPGRQVSAYYETSVEDDAICQSIQRGREELFWERRTEAGTKPVDSPILQTLEQGLINFYDYLRAQYSQP